MPRPKKVSRAPAACAILVFAAAPAVRADDFTSTGTGATDDGIRFFAFNVTSSSTVTISTAGSAQGGFGSFLYISLFRVSPGVAVDGLPLDNPFVGPLPTDFVNGSALVSTAFTEFADDLNEAAGLYDSFLQVPLDSGFYIFSVTQFGNVSAGPTLRKGFSQQGNGNYQAGFTDAFGVRRTGFFSATISGPGVTQAAPVPETTAMLL